MRAAQLHDQRLERLFLQDPGPADFTAYMAGNSPFCLKETDVPYPSDTVAIGEKLTALRAVLHGYSLKDAGNEIDELELGRHSGYRSLAAGPQNGS